MKYAYMIEIRDENKTDINGKPKGVTWNTMWETASPTTNGAFEKFAPTHNGLPGCVYRVAQYKLIADDNINPEE